MTNQAGAGALGLGDSSNESKPVLVESLADEGIRLQSIDSGEQHMIALDEKNQVHTSCFVLRNRLKRTVLGLGMGCRRVWAPRRWRQL